MVTGLYVLVDAKQALKHSLAHLFCSKMSSGVTVRCRPIFKTMVLPEKQ